MSVNGEKKFKIDALDIKIIEIMEEDCSKSYDEISKETGKSLWTVRDRIILLKQRGVIKGCKAQVDFPSIGMHCRAFLSFNVPAEMIDKIVKFARTQSRIKRTIITTGQRRFVMEILGEDCSEIREYARKELPQFGIYDIDLQVVLDEIQ
ncbi:MAG: Lrp/AsnC family transcriptional regulator [Candidatus Thermoplasmatota archaeon]|jgi:DNA-binding Lrp family transcriptional regulator|nr:Lrp/AsnC family transcriptional regulator [Candidatus Thermoplasmatota archaeon]MCL5790998.1 Lrp/AsnC family transcriptional regulator [Candidatus Thermoplasmatota archaeon]